MLGRCLLVCILPRVLVLIGVLARLLLKLPLRAIPGVRVESNIHASQLQTHILHELPQLRQVTFYQVPGGRLLGGEGKLQLIASPLHLDIEMSQLSGSELESNAGQLLRLVLQQSLNQGFRSLLPVCQ